VVRILIAGNGTDLAAAVTRSLSTDHDVKLIAAADALDRDRAADAAAGRHTIIHFPLLAEPASSALDAPDALYRLDLAGRTTYNLITTAAGAKRFIQISTLRHFYCYPPEWLVTERWAPSPSSHVDDLAPYLAETVVRETARVLPLRAITLRLDDPHLEDALQAIDRALAFEPKGNGWWVFHIPASGARPRFILGEAGQPSFGYLPRHAASTTPRVPATAPHRHPERSEGSVPTEHTAPKNVLVFGAGGPIGASFTTSASNDHILRLADIRPLADIVAENKPFGPGAPMPRVPEPPHEAHVTDVTDLTQVLDAAEGMDAIVNVSVMRNHPVDAFRVNMLGAYNVMRTAVRLGIKRVVHTGPTQALLNGPAGYSYDDDVPSDAPPRPGTELYFMSKLLGQQICRIFAHEHDLDVPCLLIGPLLNPDPTLRPPNVPHGAYPFSVSWADAGHAIHAALHAPPLPRPFEVMHLVANLPHGRFSNEKTKRLLNWQPQARLEAHWRRDLPQGDATI